MTTLKKLDPITVSKRIKCGDAVLVDIREVSEHRREYIAGAISSPISLLESAGLTLETGKQTIFHCKSGMRTDAHCVRLSRLVDGDKFMLGGGLDAWKKAGLPTVTDANAPLEIPRQVQITAGILILVGVFLGSVIHVGFYGLSAFVGAGLTFAGLTGWCGMANVLALMPWNRNH